MALNEVLPENWRVHSREKMRLGGVLALTLLTFASTCTFGWVYDDAPQIPGNPDLRWERLGFLFGHHLWASANGITNARFYRPLLAVWFLINKTVFGLHPQWFHVTTVLAHLVATTLVFFIARELLRDTGGALLAAAIFGVHPLQVESVSWISAVNDPLAAIFCFASFLACRKARAAIENPASLWFLSAVCFLGALLVKEVSVVLPAILLIDVCFDPHGDAKGKAPRGRKATTILGLYGSLAIVWLLVRHRVVGQVAATTSGVGWSAAMLGAPKILLWQLSRVLLPIGLSPHYDFRLGTFAALALCGTIVVLGAAFLLARKLPSLWVAFAWLLLPALPSLNVRWLNEDDFVHDRYMYMSMLGAALLAGAGFVALRRRWPEQRLVPGLVFALIVGLSFASAIQSQFWANDVALFARGVEIAPQNEWAQLNYGAALSARGKNAEAAPHFVKSYELKRGWKAADYAGFAFENSGDTTDANRWYALALQNNPNLADAWFALGQIRLRRQRAAEAVPFFQKSIAIAPDGEGYHYALGKALEALGNVSGALAEYRLELRLHPWQAGARKEMERLNEGEGQ